MTIHRRGFLSASTAAAAGLMLTSPRRARAAAPVDGPRIAVVGVKSRGRGHMGALSDNLVALCDVDQRILDQRAREFAERHGRELDKVTDFRRLMERDDIDAVSIATPNHTHSLIAIVAIEAGKDVYVEKPVSHNVWEGRQLVEAARKHGRIVQCGTQARSSTCLQEAVAWVRGGGLGKIEYVVGTCYKPREPIGKLDQPLEIPDSIDYDLWCGPAAKQDIYRPHLHYDWHWDFNTGAGDMGNQGIHQMDIARWFLGANQLPPRSLSIGGRLGYEDAGDTPNTQVVLHDYAEAPLVFETRGLPRSKEAQRRWGRSMDEYRGSGIGVIVQCEEGHVYASNSYREVVAYNRDGEEVKRFRGGGDHHGNWLNAVEAKDPSRLNAEVLEGHLSSALCHVGNTSHALGETKRAEEIAEAIVGNDLFTGAFERMCGHLRANDVRIDGREGALRMGAWLEIDPQAEQLTNVDEPPSLWKRTGRTGFQVPEIA